MTNNSSREIEEAEPASYHHMHEQHDHHQMKMYFHFGLGDQLLFESLILDRNSKLVGACVLLCLASLLNETIRRLRTIECRCELAAPFKWASRPMFDHEHDDNFPAPIYRCCDCYQGNGSSGRHYDQTNDNDSNPRRFGGGGQPAIQHCEYRLLNRGARSIKLVQVGLHLIGHALSLTLMLAAMSFNVCLIFSILFGSAIGTYLFERRSREPAASPEQGQCH